MRTPAGGNERYDRQCGEMTVRCCVSLCTTLMKAQIGNSGVRGATSTAIRSWLPTGCDRAEIPNQIAAHDAFGETRRGDTSELALLLSTDRTTETVADAISHLVAKLGENIAVRRF